MLSRREIKKILSCAWEDHILNINLCVKFVIPLIFTEIQRKGIRLFNKSNSLSLMYRWFIYVTMEPWKVPRQGHFIFVLFIRLFRKDNTLKNLYELPVLLRVAT